VEAIERYVREKVSGSRALALDFIQGVLDSQINDAKTAASAEKAARGVVQYMGSVIIALMGDTPVNHVRIPLSELPDGFNRKEEFDIAILTFARALGVPVQDLQPLSGQGLGTGAQTVVLDEASKGMGLAAWRKDWTHAVNQYVLDDRTTFYFHERDIRDREREAKVRIDEAAAVKTWVDMGSITPPQATQLGVDRDQLPKEFIPADVTAGDALSDVEKPEEEQPTEIVAPAPVPSAAPIPSEKESETVVIKLHSDRAQELALLDRIAEQGDVLRGILEMMNAGGEAARAKAARQDESLHAALVVLSDALSKVRALEARTESIRAASDQRGKAAQATLGALRESLSALRTAPEADRKLIGEVARQAVALFSKSQEVISNRVVIKDAQGRPLKVEKKYADGRIQTYHVKRAADGQIESLLTE